MKIYSSLPLDDEYIMSTVKPQAPIAVNPVVNAETGAVTVPEQTRSTAAVQQNTVFVEKDVVPTVSPATTTCVEQIIPAKISSIGYVALGGLLLMILYPMFKGKK